MPVQYYRSLGIVNYYEQNFLEAAQALQRALALSPNDRESNEMLSLVYSALGNNHLSNKMKVRNQTIRFSYNKNSDEQFETFRNDMRLLGNNYYNRSIYDSAILAYKLQLKINIDDTATLFYLANSYFFLRNFNDAVQNYEKLIAINKKRADVYNLAGVCYRNMDNILRARDYFKQCLINDENFAVAYFNLGSAQYALEDFVHAEANLLKANELLAGDKEVLELLGKLYMETAQKEKALNTFEQLFVLNKNSEKVNVVLGQLYFENGDFEKTIFHLSNALNTVKNNVELKSILGTAYLRLRKYDTAFELLKQAADVMIERKEVQTAVAETANNLKHYKEANEYAERALALDKNYKPALTALVTSLKGMRKISAARKIQKQVKSN